MPVANPSFAEAYHFSVMQKNARESDVTLIGSSFDKYLKLIALSLRIFEIIKFEISKDQSKVVDLIELSDDWKEKIQEIFDYQSEYISFLYFINLRRRGKGRLRSNWVRFICWWSLALRSR
ncbi:hypothetical protein MHLP_01915 [Candidatus Mycoplasma haematolamae str. Purdue]|uniref:Uncharacterized protein n=1 Tax=Mycoplasma haematolamae (strain Purdue) TaxID=1212765 RepID=I7BJE9_MYCHA|nr:hypothetical protein [Candidatus Mycoplasma haematolamae]AFO51963.1 hypothetical protein MHLP_01915 [Candidatus Mycoplasma haematolamae str. Purdue]